ncbi:MAG: type VI secretion system contractile sheath large subunit, partial [Myxococcota bacterium]|nr:type VI secretion system contractile sheath large subunit [Myxococcota bacterium]
MSAEESAGGGGGSTSLLDEIIGTTKSSDSAEEAAVVKRGVSALLEEMLGRTESSNKVDKGVVDEMIAAIDQKLSLQVDQIIHSDPFQKLESAWRGLKLMVDRTDFRENNKVQILNISKEQLLEDFEDAPEVVQSGLYKHVYTAEYGTFGGEPVGAIVANYDFGPGSQDIKLLQSVSAVSAMAHAPFIAAAGSEFFGLESFEGMPNLKDLDGVFEGPRYTKWQAFRDSPNSRYVGLTCPRFLLRLPYDPEENPVKAFDYQETVTDDHENYLWGNTAFAFATRLTESFANYRWCPNIIGPTSGGTVPDLPVHLYDSMGELTAKIPTECLVSDRKEFELAEQGFIPLAMRKGSDNAAFFSANSCQRPKRFPNTPEGKAAETNYKLGTQLPYMFVIARLSHYVKVLQREQLGSFKERGDLERELNEWIKQYVSDQDVVSASVRARRPLRKAQILVEDVEGDPGWYRVKLNVRP